MKNIVIYGTGGFAREVFQLLSDINEKEKVYNFLGFIDDDLEKLGQYLYNYPILGNIEWLETNRDVLVTIGIGNTVSKRKIAARLDSKGIKSPILIHPSVIVGQNVEFGQGSIICALNVITVDIKFGQHVILNLDCTVGHDAVIQDFVTVSPGSHISGNVHIGEGVDIGTGSSLIQGVHVGSWSILGAGSVVSKNIPQDVTAVGIPARPVKERENGWHLV
jgi:sugar O-acyltransferase (sialic acid O-acetyltransferase NeuD family)